MMQVCDVAAGACPAGYVPTRIPNEAAPTVALFSAFKARHRRTVSRDRDLRQSDNSRGSPVLENSNSLEVEVPLVLPEWARTCYLLQMVNLPSLR